MSLDARIAGAGGRRMVFSDPEDQVRVHRMRSRHQAVLVGVGTVLSDDPRLTVRKAEVSASGQPLRVVLDSRGRTPEGARVLDDAAKTLVYCDERAEAVARGDSWVGVPASDAQGLDLEAVLKDLKARGVGDVMVEGGARVISSFLAASFVDELFVFVVPVVVGTGAPSLVVTRAGEGPLAGFRVIETEARASGVLLRLGPEHER